MLKYEEELKPSRSLISSMVISDLIGSKTVNWKEEDKEALFPRYGGYSSSGVVVKVGEGVTDINPGDRAALSWSTHSQFVNVVQDRVYKIDDISFEVAALFHIPIFPLAAIRKCRLEIGESAIVMGMGILGIVALQLLKAAGTAPIVAVDPDPDKRQKALLCGADYALYHLRLILPKLPKN